ncbi:MAG: hypothetical protein RJA09_2512 [Pseudomonadota bacterium]
MLMPALSVWGALTGARRLARVVPLAATPSTLWCLRPGQAAGVRTRAASALRVLEGRLWVTLGAGADPVDHCLGPGEVLLVPIGAHLVMEPLSLGADTGPVRVDWSGAAGTPQPAPSGWSTTP